MSVFELIAGATKKIVLIIENGRSPQNARQVIMRSGIKEVYGSILG